MLLIDHHLLDDAPVGQLVVSLVLLRRDFLGQLRRVISLHQCLHTYLTFLIGCDILRLHKLWTQLLTVKTGCEVPLVGVLVALKGMSVRDFLTIDGHHLRLTWLVNFLASGLFRCLLYGLILFLGLSLVFGFNLNLVNLGFLSLGPLLFCFLFHSIGLSLVLGLLCSLVCGLFLAQLLHVSNRHAIASPDESWQVNIQRMMRKLSYELTVLLEFGLLCRDVQCVGHLPCILIK